MKLLKDVILLTDDFLIFFQFFLLCSILDSFHCYIIKFTNSFFCILAEDEAGGRVVLTVRPPEGKWAGILWTCHMKSCKFNG